MSQWLTPLVNIMSRRGRGSAAAKKVASGPPPSHPSETNREHRKFLIRSLERNDVDINALIELNKSLRTAKANVLRSCRESVLLDLGSGRLQLINDELHIATAIAKDSAASIDQQRKQDHLTPTQTMLFTTTEAMQTSREMSIRA